MDGEHGRRALDGDTHADEGHGGFRPQSGADNAGVVNEIDANVPTATVTALPAKSAPGTLHVRWKGSDGDGSGVASYDVYVSVDGGPLTLWKGDTTLTTATYPVTAGHAYGFAVRATNHVGTSGAVPRSPRPPRR